MTTITVVGNAPFPDIPLGRAVTVEHTPRIDGLLASGRIVRVDEPEPDPVEVPRTIDAVRRWVDGDPERARIAMDLEQERTGGPRSTLVAWLEVRTDRSDDLGVFATDHTPDESAAGTGDPGALD